MKIPLLCDQCSKEFMADEELMYIDGELRCDDCEEAKTILQ